MTRQWYRFTVEGITYEVFASSPDTAREWWTLWNESIPYSSIGADLPEWLRVVEFAQ